MIQLCPAHRYLAFFLLTIFLLTSSPKTSAENWPRFRGKNGVGVSDQKGLPVQWTEDDYDWSIKLNGTGHSSPIVWGKYLFVTSAANDGKSRMLDCLDAETGQQRWGKSLPFKTDHLHQKNSWASATPATDGIHVYVTFADDEQYMLFAFDFQGNEIWKASLGKFDSQHGQGVSPIVYKDLVILANDQDGPSSLRAFDRKTGDVKWKVERPNRKVSYATPIILRRENKSDQLITVSGMAGVRGYRPEDGKLIWQTSSFPLRTVASPIACQGLVFASCGQGSRGGVELRAVSPDGRGDVSDTRVKFVRTRQLPYVPTPIACDGYVFLWNDGGVVCCVNPKTGENIWVKRVGGDFSGSPVCIDGKLYCISESGDVVVLRASDKYEFLGKSPLPDRSQATPAVANGRLFLRSFEHLTCIKAGT